MSARRAFFLFHLLLFAIMLAAGWRWSGYDVLVDDELRNLITVRNIAATGHVWLTEERAAYYHRQFGDRYPLSRSFLGGTYYSKYGVPNLLPLVVLQWLQPRAVVYGNLLWLALILWVLRRFQLVHGRPDANYYLAALFLVFGSTVALYWFGLFAHIAAGALLLAECHFITEYARTGRGRALWLAGLCYVTMVMVRLETSVFGLLPLAVVFWQQGARLPRRRLALTVLLLLVLLAGGYTMVFNYCKTGSVIDSGEGNLAWSLSGLWGNLVQPHRNLLLTNLPLLLIVLEWRNLRHYLPQAAAALGAWLLYSLWHMGNYGYMRFLQTVIILLLPALLLTRIRPLVLTLFAIGLLLNVPYFYLPLFDVAEVMRGSDVVPGAWHDPWAALHMFLLLLRGAV